MFCSGIGFTLCKNARKRAKKVIVLDGKLSKFDCGSHARLRSGWHGGTYFVIHLRIAVRVM